MPDTLDADGVRRWLTAAQEAMTAARDEIDALNVYPVPDGDTGTNLLLTISGASEAAIVGGGGTLGEVLADVARAALLSARGSSGVILSQLLRGFADELAERAQATGDDLARALARGSDAAYAAVAEPVEGTVLTVARAAAKAAADAPAGSPGAVVAAACRAAEEALALTPLQLPALSAAGVVDAGGRGLVVVLDALCRILGGSPAKSPKAHSNVVARERSALTVAREAGSGEFGYEVQYLLDARDEAIPSLRERLRELGDALVVVGGDGLFNVHVHVNDIGAAIEAGIAAGRPHRICVTRFADQGLPEPTVRPIAASRVVAVTPPGGLEQLFHDAGAVTVRGGIGASCSTGDIADAIRASRNDHVVVLPNARDLRAVADAAAELTRAEGRTVVVVPTRSPLQGLAAIAVHDDARRFDDDVIAMSAAAAATRTGAVTVAVRDAQTSAGRCKAGDVLGLIDDDVALIGHDIGEVSRGLLDRMLIGGGEIVTVATGAGAPDGLGDMLADYVASTRPAVEVAAYDGGQPHYPLLVGVE